MKCPECSNLFGDELRGKQHCNECNTSLTVVALPDKAPYLAIRAIHKTVFYKTEAERKKDSKKASTVKRTYILGDALPDLNLRCFHCSTVISKMTAVRGNTIVGWKLVEVVSATGQLEDKQVPQFKEVYACTRCLSELNEILPDKVVNPIKDDKNGVVRNVKDVTRDPVRADDHDTAPCTTYVTNEFTRARNPGVPVGNCLYCGRPENTHHIEIRGSHIYAESFNV